MEEFRVSTTNSNADSGRSSGAQVTLVTKSGTNTLHGSLYEYNRTNFGHANNWFNKAAEIEAGLPNKPGQLIRNTFGGTFGGPIKKDKIFFFINYEGQKTQENQQQSLTVPTASFVAGNVSYNCAGSTGCPASGVQTLTPAQIASMDPICTTTCPWGPRDDPNALTTFKAYPGPIVPGGDGLNTGGFTWSAPDPARLNTYIVKFDYQLSDRQRLFVRGNLQGDRSSSAPEFPGDPPAHGEDPGATISPIPYFEDLFPTAAAGGFSATQNIYTGSGGTNACPSGLSWANRPGREVGAPFRLGLIATALANGGESPVCAGLPPVPFWDPQFSSLFAWSSLGTSSYNAGQVMLRHPASHGLQVDFSYTYSKSLDLGSDAERTNSQGTTSTTTPVGQGVGTVLSYIANPWNPGLNRAPSDFDLRHVITADWVYEFPFGKGKRFAGGSGSWLNAIIGDWQLAGLTRWTSGFPFSAIDSRGFTQNFLFESNMVQTGSVSSGVFMISGAPYAFPNPSAVVAGVQITPDVPATLTPMRFAYPGEAGSRNNFRGPGYFGIDMRLAKSWKVRERMDLKFAWEVFNLTNSVRFDTNTNTSLDNGSDDGSFGLYRATLSVERVQQFSLTFGF
ncbi:MAG: hypothetical protein WA604_21780 [Candidatus Sulfotelmatobacter sp.]